MPAAKRRGFSMRRRPKRPRRVANSRARSVAARGKYGGKKRVTRRRMAAAKKLVRKKAVTKRTSKVIKGAVEALLKDHQETKGTYVTFDTPSATSLVVANGLDFTLGAFSPYLPKAGTPQTVLTSTWNPVHFVYPQLSYGDTATTRDGDEVHLHMMDNRHTLQITWPAISYGHSADMVHADDELWCIEVLLKKHSAADFEISAANDASSALSIMKQWSMRKFGIPLPDSGAGAMALVTANIIGGAGNVLGSVTTNWKKPRAREREWATGVKDRIAVSAPVVRQRVRRFTRADAPMRSYQRHNSIIGYTDTAPPSAPNLYTAQTGANDCSFPLREHYVRAGFVVPHRGEKIVYKGGSTEPRTGYEYAQIWAYRNRRVTSSSSASTPTVKYIDGHIRVRFNE